MRRRSRVASRLAPHPRVLAGSWVAVLFIVLVCASDFRFTGGRSQSDALAGAVDARAFVVFGLFLLTGAYLMFNVARPPTGQRIPTLLIALWGFTLAMVLVAIWSPYPKLAAARSVQLMITAGLAHAVARYGKPDQLWRLAHAYIVVITVSIAFGIVVRYPPEPGLEGRFTWTLMHPNIAGSYLGASTVLLAACLLLRKAGNVHMRWPSWWYGLGLAIHFGALVATRSRGALAASVAALLVVAWSGSKRRSRLDLALMGAALITIVFLLAGGDILTYLQRGDTAKQLGTLNSRTEVWSQGWQLFRLRPVLGHGFMSSRGAFLETFGLGGAHNAFVEALVDGGAFGTVWFTAVILLGLRASGRLGTARRDEGPILQGLFVVLLVNGFTEGGLAQAATVQNMWLYLAIGWAAAAQRWVAEDREAERVTEQSTAPVPVGAGPAISSDRSGRARPARSGRPFPAS